MLINDIRVLIGVCLKNLKKLDLSITYKCNARCQACKIWELYRNCPEKAGEERTLGFYDQFFARNDFWNWVSLTGGEPFLREDMADIASLITRRCRRLYALTIPTNGLLGEGIVRTVKTILAGTRCRIYMSVSLDGPADIHDRSKGVPGAFERAVAVFRGLREINDPRLSVRYEYVISTCNQGKLAEFFAHHPFEIQRFCLTVAQESYRYGHDGGRPAVPERSLLDADITYFLKHYRVRSFFDLCQKTFLRCVLNGIKIPCVAGKNTFYMDPYGRILRCTLIDQPVDLAAPLSGRRCGISCYTPCESYYGLVLGSRRELLANILRYRK